MNRRTRTGWLCFAALLDLHWRENVGCAMAAAILGALVRAALQMAIIKRNLAAGLIVHSDRGTQYVSAELEALLARHGLVGSMSRKGNCWDNAVMERFFLNLKMERVWQKRTMPIMKKPSTRSLTTLMALTRVPGCTQHWATFQPTAMDTYCLPSTVYVAGTATTPVPVATSRSFSPVLAL